MVGLLMWKTPRKGQKRIEMEESAVLRMRFLRLAVTSAPNLTVMRRRAAAACRRLRKAGVVQVVPPENFPFRELLEKNGLRPVPTLSLRRSLAADWVRSSLGEKDLSLSGARVAIAAGSLTGEVVRTVTELCLRHRYVLLDLPYGGEELCRQLRREYGVSLLLGPSKEQLEEAEALVLFDQRLDLSMRNPVMLRLYDDAAPLPRLTLPPDLEAELPEGLDRGRLLAALREAGAVRRDQISVSPGP